MAHHHDDARAADLLATLGDEGARDLFRQLLQEALQQLLTGATRPEPGDVVLARVDRLGNHTRLEQPDGRRANLFVGDEMIVAYGHRYATDQFEAHDPDSLEPCHLVASGVAARVVSIHELMTPPTEMTPLGLVSDAHGTRLNLRQWALPDAQRVFRPPNPDRVSAELLPRSAVASVLATSRRSGLHLEALAYLA